MSSPPPHAGGGYDDRGLQGPPAVYLPQAAPAPAYDAYTDPATAHGWQNAYDETRELPPVAGAGPGSPEDGVAPPPGGAGADPVYDAGAPSPEGGAIRPAGDGAESAPGRSRAGGPRHGPGRRGRRKAAPWRSRRAVVAAGAVGVVSVAALIAGFAFSGSPSGGAEGGDDRTGPTAGESGAASPGPDASGPAEEPAGTGGPSAGRGSPGATSGSGGGREADGAPSGPSADASTTSTPTLPTATPSASTGSGQSGPGNAEEGRGRGQGPKKAR